jgi:hypothetical protein
MLSGRVWVRIVDKITSQSEKGSLLILSRNVRVLPAFWLDLTAVCGVPVRMYDGGDTAGATGGSSWVCCESNDA